MDHISFQPLHLMIPLPERHLKSAGTQPADADACIPAALPHRWRGPPPCLLRPGTAAGSETRNPPAGMGRAGARAAAVITHWRPRSDDRGGRIPWCTSQAAAVHAVEGAITRQPPARGRSPPIPGQEPPGPGQCPAQAHAALEGQRASASRDGPPRVSGRGRAQRRRPVPRPARLPPVRPLSLPPR